MSDIVVFVELCVNFPAAARLFSERNFWQCAHGCVHCNRHQQFAFGRMRMAGGACDGFTIFSNSWCLQHCRLCLSEKKQRLSTMQSSKYHGAVTPAAPFIRDSMNASCWSYTARSKCKSCQSWTATLCTPHPHPNTRSGFSCASPACTSHA